MTAEVRNLRERKWVDVPKWALPDEAKSAWLAKEGESTFAAIYELHQFPGKYQVAFQLKGDKKATVKQVNSLPEAMSYASTVMNRYKLVPRLG